MSTTDQKDSNPSENNVYDFFTGRPYVKSAQKIVRIAPEYDGLEVLYSNDTASQKLYSLKIICWALREDGEIFAMVPWLNQVMPAPEINDPLNGRWEGYRDPLYDEIFYMAPQHKIVELESAEECFGGTYPADQYYIQELPDAIGTHAVLTDNGFKSFSLIEILSWKLSVDGQLHGMLIDDNRVTSTPVLPGDRCLFPAQTHPDFKYFFQHRIANKIKEEDPEAMAAIAMLREY